MHTSKINPATKSTDGKSPTVAILMLTQLSEEYQVLFKILLALLIGKHLQAQSHPAAM